MKLNVRSDYRGIVFINPPPLGATISSPLEDKKGKEKNMSALKKTISLGLAALSVAGALTATAPAAEARDRHRNVWPGVAAGLAGGIIGGAIIAGSQRPAYAEPEYVEPEYDYAPPPPPPVYYRRAYYRDYPPVCELEWRRNRYGEPDRVEVCSR
jgi:hypothetical protein